MIIKYTGILWIKNLKKNILKLALIELEKNIKFYTIIS